MTFLFQFKCNSRFNKFRSSKVFPVYLKVEREVERERESFRSSSKKIFVQITAYEIWYNVL